MGDGYPLPHYEWAMQSEFGFDLVLDTCNRLLNLKSRPTGDKGKGPVEWINIRLPDGSPGKFGTEYAAEVVCLKAAETAGEPYDEPSKIETHCMLEFEKWGHQVFCLPKIMQEKLDHTDVSRVGREELDRLPYQCFYVNLRDCDRVAHGTEDGLPHQLSGFYVMRNTKKVVHDPLRVGGQDMSIDGAAHHLSGLMHDEEVSLEIRTMDTLTFFLHAEGLNGGFGSKNYIVIDLKKCFEQFDCVRDYLKSLHGDPSRNDSTPGITVDVPSQLDNHDWVFRVLASLLMYLNTESPDVRRVNTSHRRKKLKDKLAGMRPGRTAATRISLKLKALPSSRSYVGESEEEKVINRPGFTWEQRRSWRRGHDHRFWRGSKLYPAAHTQAGLVIPYNQWTTATYPSGHEREGELIRDLATKWVKPTIINPEKEPSTECREYWFSLGHKQKHAALRRAFKEGRLKEVVLSAYERNPAARAACLEHYGCVCQVCDYEPAKDHKLGSLVGRYLQVHHLKPVHTIGKEYEVDPIQDLVPLCYECHKYVHSRGTKKPPYSVEELRDLIAHLALESPDHLFNA